MNRAADHPHPVGTPSRAHTYLPGFLGVYTLTALLAIGARPTWISVVAPIAGPWAGHLYGHAGCTMASQMPTISLTALLAFPVLAVPAMVWRSRSWAGLPLLLWSVAWATLTWMSVVNSTE